MLKGANPTRATGLIERYPFLAGIHIGVELTNEADFQQKKADAKKKFTRSLLVTIVWFIADAINWISFIGYNNSASMVGAIAFTGVVLMYANFAYTDYHEYKTCK